MSTPQTVNDVFVWILLLGNVVAWGIVVYFLRMAVSDVKQLGRDFNKLTRRFEHLLGQHESNHGKSIDDGR